MRPVLVLAIASALLLAACGSDAQPEEPAETPGASGQAPDGMAPAETAPTPDDAAVASYALDSACDLLGVVDVEIAADGGLPIIDAAGLAGKLFSQLKLPSIYHTEYLLINSYIQRNLIFYLF